MGVSDNKQFYRDLKKQISQKIKTVKKGNKMNLREKVYQTIMNELNIKENDVFIIKYFSDGSQNQLECVFKKGELLNARTHDILSGKMLSKLLANSTTVEKKPWKPKVDEEYYYYSPISTRIFHRNFTGTTDIAMYKMKNCFRLPKDITDDDKIRITMEYQQFLDE